MGFTIDKGVVHVPTEVTSATTAPYIKRRYAVWSVADALSAGWRGDKAGFTVKGANQGDLTSCKKEDIMR